MSDDFWEGFDFPTLGNSVGNDDALSQPIAPTPGIEAIATDLKKRAMVVFFIIDISGSMKGNRIQAVNDAIRNLIPELKKKEDGDTNAEIKIAILEFSSDANWRTAEPVPVSRFIYNDITYVSGGTNFGKAFEKLNEKLSRNAFMKSSAGSFTPLIILMTDGKPSDIALYPEELAELKKNSWFQYATKAGIAIEEGALSPECRKVLLEFTGKESMVLLAANTNVLAKQIELVTLTGVDFVTQRGSVQNNTPVTAPSNEQPHRTQSAAAQPAAAQPVTAQPVTAQPAAAQPVTDNTPVIDPASGVDPEIPGMAGIDWNDFPTFS